MRIVLVATVLCLSAGSALTQTREAGPWWPNPTWGRGDQAGASNWITPEKVLEAVRLVKTGKIYEIGQVGTQFDGPGHIGMKVTIADGSQTEVGPPTPIPAWPFPSTRS